MSHVDDEIKVFVKGLDGREKFPPDTYGAFHYMLIRWVNGEDDEDELTDDKHKALEAPAFMGVVHTGIWLSVSILCQWIAMFLLDVFTNTEAADKFQKLNHAYFTYSEVVQNLNLKNATAMLTSALVQNSLAPLNSTMGKQVIAHCNADGTVPWSLELFLFIMGVAFVAKFLQVSLSIWRHAVQVHLDTDDDIPEDANYWSKNPLDYSGKQRFIIYETRQTKVLGICMVKLPELATIVYLYFVGAQMLCTATTLYKVILKSLGLSLVAKLPHTFFAFCIEDTIQKMTEKTFIAFKQDKDAHHWPMRLFLLPLLKILVTFFVTMMFTHVQYYDADQLRDACFAYSNKFVLPKCLESWPCGGSFLGRRYFSH